MRIFISLLSWVVLFGMAYGQGVTAVNEVVNDSTSVLKFEEK